MTATNSIMPLVIGSYGDSHAFGRQFRQGNRIYSIKHISPALQANNGNLSGGSVLILLGETNETDY